MTRLRSFGAVLVVVTLALAGCDLQTAGAPMGDLSFVARFDDVQHLVTGHSVRVADVTVGTVTGVDLDGYDAVVEMSIVDGRELPVGTTASISTTSLLGENYVRLRLPESGGEPLPDGAELPTAGADASFEELTLQLLTLTRAVQGRDAAAVVEAGAEALGGRGDDLGDLVRTAGQLTRDLAAQRGSFEVLVDRLGQLGQSLAPEADEIGQTIELANEATGELASQRDRLVQTVQEITTLAGTLDAEVLTPHRAAIDGMLADLAPVVSTIDADVGTLVESLQKLVIFNENIPRASGGGVLLSYAIFDTFTFDDRMLHIGGLGQIMQTLLHPDLDDLGGTVDDVTGSGGGLVDELLGAVGGTP